MNCNRCIMVNSSYIGTLIISCLDLGVYMVPEKLSYWLHCWASELSHIPESCTYELTTLSRPASDVTVRKSTLHIGNIGTTSTLSCECCTVLGHTSSKQQQHMTGQDVTKVADVD
eukprot:4391-Heterococcus_DN1.PRE.1